MQKINGDYCHDLLCENAPRRLSYYKKGDYSEWKKAVKQKFVELFKIDRIKENAGDLNLQITNETMMDGYLQIDFTFESEKGAIVPCHLLIPNTGKTSYPVAITLQGHSTGVHSSLGIKKFDFDESYQPRGAFGLQAVESGFAALCIEQRAMGQLRSPREYGEGVPFKARGHMCAVPSFMALSLGRTILGERIWDVHRGIDALQTFAGRGLELDKILITGNSGGGTVSYYAACYDERIKYSAPSCSFCSYKTSIMDIEHCACNYVPDICTWFEMEDMACLIAPRKLTVFAGVLDDIFPIDGVRASYKTVTEIYQECGVKDNCRLVETPKNHWWCNDIIWPVLCEETKKLGW